MNNSQRPGVFLVFKGALRARLLLGLDRRLVIFCMVLIFPAIYVLWLWLVIAAIVVLGRMAGNKSTFLLDEIGAFLAWRQIAWHGFMPHDAYWTTRDPEFRTKSRRTRL